MLHYEADRFLFVRAYGLAQLRFHIFLLHTITQQSVWHHCRSLLMSTIIPNIGKGSRKKLFNSLSIMLVLRDQNFWRWAIKRFVQQRLTYICTSNPILDFSFYIAECSKDGIVELASLCNSLCFLAYRGMEFLPYSFFPIGNDRRSMR